MSPIRIPLAEFRHGLTLALEGDFLVIKPAVAAVNKPAEPTVTRIVRGPGRYMGAIPGQSVEVPVSAVASDPTVQQCTVTPEEWAELEQAKHVLATAHTPLRSVPAPSPALPVPAPPLPRGPLPRVDIDAELDAIG